MNKNEIKQALFNSSLQELHKNGKHYLMWKIIILYYWFRYDEEEEKSLVWMKRC